MINFLMYVPGAISSYAAAAKTCLRMDSVNFTGKGTSRHFSGWSDISSGSLFGSTDVRPIKVWAQSFARNDSAGKSFDGRAMNSRDGSVTSHPLMHGRNRQAERTCQRGLTADNFTSLIDCFCIHWQSIAKLQIETKPRYRFIFVA